MLLERKIIHVMIYNQLVSEHNRLCEEVTKTDVAPEGFYDKTKMGSDLKIDKIDAASVVDTLSNHLNNEYTAISPERKQYLRDNLSNIDMIFDPITPSERAFLINLKAEEILKRTQLRKQKEAEEMMNLDIDDIIYSDPGYESSVESTIPPVGSSISNDLEDTITLSRRHGGLEDTMPTGVVGQSYKYEDDDEKTFKINRKKNPDDTKELYEMAMSRGALIRKKYYGRY